MPYTPEQIAKRTALLARWRDERLRERREEWESYKTLDTGPLTPRELELITVGYREGWTDLARLMAMHEQFKPDFGA